MFALDSMQVSHGTRLALEIPRLDLVAGRAVAVMGPNGSGKTTLLRVLAGLQRPTAGSVRKDEATVVAFVPQHQQHHPWMPLTAGEVLATGRYRDRGLLGRLRATDRESITRAAARLDIADLLPQPFGSLSGGQRQRVLLAAALVQNADCLLLDEPITGLDLMSQRTILEVIATERADGRLVVVTTHHLAEARHFDRVVLLNTQVVADGPPCDVLQPVPLAAAFGPQLLAPFEPGGSRWSPDLVVIDDHGAPTPNRRTDS